MFLSAIEELSRRLVALLGTSDDALDVIADAVDVAGTIVAALSDSEV